MINIPNLINKAAKKLGEARRVVRHSFQPHPDSVDILSAQDQLKRFLESTPAELQALRMRWGDVELERYIKAQLRNMRRYGSHS